MQVGDQQVEIGKWEQVNVTNSGVITKSNVLAPPALIGPLNLQPLIEPDPKRARNSAATIAVSYILGGLVPLAPYILVSELYRALSLSVGVTLVALFLFGYVKGKMTGISPLRGGFQTVIIGGLASAAAFGLAKAISG